MKKHINIPIFVPHHGCLHDCIFCNQKKISGYKTSFNEHQIRDEIERYLSTAKGVPHIEIAFFGGSFTGIPIEEQRSYLELATEYIHKYDLNGIRLSTRPDMITKEILDFLRRYPVIGIELGVQSMSDVVLQASKRGHTAEDVINACKLIHSYPFELGLQMMLGLPKDTVALSRYTADQIIGLEPDMVRIYPTLVIKDTELATLYQEGLYTPWDLKTTIDLCLDILPRFEAAGIKVLRIGLQTTQEIQLGQDIVAGPFHPALSQLIEEKRLVNYILDYVKDMKTSIYIEANHKLYQALVGHKKRHLSIWSDHDPVINISQNADLPKHILKIGNTYHNGYKHAILHHTK
ncbi:elongator complex protein 3 [Petrocella sp. FN5]|uniref:elongator complex protein 3 n=1 Tax=Petrocella sp. FN5 TaxID=3032002 RepID=UPI0023D9E9E0|nr:radical SAM protein [Petrocella sp. FN5]MDF1618395.1 radical SAM protein [Petrocella sp. FN5]